MASKQTQILVRQLPLFWLAKRAVGAVRKRQWETGNRQGLPPHSFKADVILDRARSRGIRTFVETGTFLGDMVDLMNPHFDRLFSIELDRELFEAAQRRFRGYRKVQLLHGDSGVELKAVLDQIAEPAVFWLDGHYSGSMTAMSESETPVSQELEHLFNHPIKNHVLLIDDAREFGCNPDYPTLPQLESAVRERCPQATFRVAHDIVRIEL